MRGLARALPIYLLLATSLGFVDFRIRTHPAHGVTDFVPHVLNGTEGPPGKYRVLAPVAYEGLARLLPVDRLISWVVFRWLCLLLAWLACHALFTSWFEANVAVFGTTFVAALLPFMFTNSTPHPDHLAELALAASACAAIARRAYLAFGTILVLAALNRETSAFLVLLLAFSEPLSSKHASRTATFGALWAVVYVGLRAVLGFQTYNAWHFRENIRDLGVLAANFDPYTRVYAWFFVVLLAGMIVPIVRTWARQPRLVRAAVLVVAPAYVATGMLFSSVIETRIFTPLLPMLAPGVIFAFFEPIRSLDAPLQV